MAKNLTQFMPAAALPEKVATGFEQWFLPEKFQGDFDAGQRNEEYGDHHHVWRINRTMCDIRVKIMGGGQGGAGQCCCQQGSPGEMGVMQMYSPCNAVMSDGQCPTGSTTTGPLGASGTPDAVGGEGQQRLMLRIGVGGCCCSTCVGHESCFTMLCHYCTGDQYYDSKQKAFICICAGAFNSRSITNCQWGYSNDTDKASNGLGGQGCHFTCSGAGCGSCCARTDGIGSCAKSARCAGWDCVECVGCAFSGFNMYRGQCCSDGRCGVLQVSVGEQIVSPFQYGPHWMGIGYACQQEHNAAHIWCQYWGKIGNAGNNFMNIRQAGRSNAVPSGCAGGCNPGSQDQGGWAYIRWKDPSYDGKIM